MKWIIPSDFVLGYERLELRLTPRIMAEVTG
jgi:hypothetical protein